MFDNTFTFDLAPEHPIIKVFANACKLSVAPENALNDARKMQSMLV